MITKIPYTIFIHHIITIVRDSDGIGFLSNSVSRFLNTNLSTTLYIDHIHTQMHTIITSFISSNSISATLSKENAGITQSTILANQRSAEESNGTTTDSRAIRTKKEMIPSLCLVRVALKLFDQYTHMFRLLIVGPSSSSHKKIKPIRCKNESMKSFTLLLQSAICVQINKFTPIRSKKFIVHNCV